MLYFALHLHIPEIHTDILFTNCHNNCIFVFFCVGAEIIGQKREHSPLFLRFSSLPLPHPNKNSTSTAPTRSTSTRSATRTVTSRSAASCSTSSRYLLEREVLFFSFFPGFLFPQLPSNSQLSISHPPYSSSSSLSLCSSSSSPFFSRPASTRATRRARSRRRRSRKSRSRPSGTGLPRSRGS